MNKKEWQREKQKDIALLVVGLVGTLLGSVLIYYLWYTGWFYHLSVESALKAYGISGRARLFEVVERVKEVNAEQRRKAGSLSEKSFNANELAADPSREVDYLIAPPRMAKYIQISTQVYNVYLKYIAPEDIHVYSID